MNLVTPSGFNHNGTMFTNNRTPIYLCEICALVVNLRVAPEPSNTQNSGFAILLQNSAFPGVLGKGITSRMLPIPVRNNSVRSSPRPNPEWGTVP
jgi:hypothetical protein